MRRTYAALLRLYPADFRMMFGAEMLESFELSGRGVTRELFAVLIGSVREQVTKRLHARTYLRSKADFETALNAKTTMQELEALIRCVIGEMKFAIAHHDFPRARLCSGQEARARECLQHLSAG